MANSSSADQPTAVGLADRIKQITAVVAALTGLVTGITALGVAAAAGWSAVGPFFRNVVKHGEIAIPAPKSTPPATPVAVLDPALIEKLESDDTPVRRQARKDLAAFVSDATPAQVDVLIDTLASTRSYRRQVGIAAALATATGGWHASDPAAAKGRVLAIAAMAKDRTLRDQLNAAARATRL